MSKSSKMICRRLLRGYGTNRLRSEFPSPKVMMNYFLSDLVSQFADIE